MTQTIVNAPTHLKITYATLFAILGFVVAGAMEWGSVKSRLGTVMDQVEQNESDIDALKQSLAIIETQVRGIDRNTERILQKLDRRATTPE